MSTTSAPEFGKIRSFLWPIHSFELRRFLPLFIIYALIVFNYSLLRATKNTLVITAPNAGAESLVFIKVWAILPMAFLFTYLFTRLSNKLSQEKIFYIMMSIFLVFFLIFFAVLYPLRDLLHPNALADKLQAALPLGFKGLISIFRNWTFTLFYVMSELWGTTIMTVLFWGFANQITSVNDARRFYGLFGVGANLATILAGNIAALFSSRTIIALLPGDDHWGNCIALLTSFILFTGVVTMFIFRWYNKNVIKRTIRMNIPDSKEKMSLKRNFAYLAKSKYLICIAVIVLAYNLSFNLIETVWNHQMKLLFPNPTDFQAYNGKVMMVMGVLSTIVGLFFCGNVIKKFGWTVSALVTPTIMLVTGFFFFSFILLQNTKLAILASLLGASPLAISVFFGSMQNCLTRSCKYTLFDSTKEMSFIPLSDECKIKGKAAIDGVGSRLGKSGGALFHQSLLMIFGSVASSTPFVALFLLIALGAYMIAVKALGKQFEAISSTDQKIDIEEGEPVEALV